MIEQTKSSEKVGHSASTTLCKSISNRIQHGEKKGENSSEDESVCDKEIDGVREREN